MNIQSIENLATKHKSLSQGVIDYEKYAYYAITHHSTAIEGSTLTETQVVDLLEYGKTAKNKPFEHHQMVFDHYQALQFVVTEAQKKRELSTEFIKEIAQKTMNSTGGFVQTVLGTYHIAKGDFRLSVVRAGNRTFPDYKKVPALVEKLCEITNDALKIHLQSSFEAKCKIAFQLHFEFVSIHPFGDGNGRTSRLLMNYVQSYFDLPLSIVYKQDRLKYIEALEKARNIENLEPFFDFMFRQYQKFLKAEIKEMEK
jgi:Fic family protein